MVYLLVDAGGVRVFDSMPGHRARFVSLKPLLDARIVLCLDVFSASTDPLLSVRSSTLLLPDGYMVTLRGQGSKPYIVVSDDEPSVLLKVTPQRCLDELADRLAMHVRPCLRMIAAPRIVVSGSKHTLVLKPGSEVYRFECRVDAHKRTILEVPDGYGLIIYCRNGVIRVPQTLESLVSQASRLLSRIGRAVNSIIFEFDAEKLEV